MAISSNYIEELIKSYPEIDEGNPSSFIVVDEHGNRTIIRFADICHANLYNLNQDKHQELITAVPVQTEASLKYIRALINGPFREWFSYIDLCVYQDGNHYIHMTDLDKIPSPVVYNFCIATRVPIEYYDVVENFCRLVSEFDVDERVALCISARVLDKNFDLDTKLEEMTVPSDGHFWFDHTSSWRTIIEGQLKLDGYESYKKAPHKCRPCNIIWGKDTKDTLQRYCEMTIGELAKEFLL